MSDPTSDAPSESFPVVAEANVALPAADAAVGVAEFTVEVNIRARCTPEKAEEVATAVRKVIGVLSPKALQHPAMKAE